jgi:hypothetical protein
MNSKTPSLKSTRGHGASSQCSWQVYVSCAYCRTLDEVRDGLAAVLKVNSACTVKLQNPSKGQGLLLCFLFESGFAALVVTCSDVALLRPAALSILSYGKWPF